VDSRERFRKCLAGEPTDRTPLFPLLMFFAADRFGVNYREYATNGHALAQAQLAMRERWGLDAISACSDAFRLPADLGGEMLYADDRTPSLARPMIASQADLDRLGAPDMTRRGGRMNDRLEAVREMARHAGDQCIITGWIEMPFAESCSLIGMGNLMVMMFENPALAHRVLEFATALEIEFGRAQLAAGADLIGAGDAAASTLGPKQFAEFAAPYEKRVVEGIHAAGSLIKLHICGNTTHVLDQMAAVGADLYNVDHAVDLATARRAYAAQGRPLKGNVDPVSQMMRSTPERCEALCHDCIRIAGPDKYMLSAGCEIPAATPDAVLEAFCRAPQTYAAGVSLRNAARLMAATQSPPLDPPVDGGRKRA
jgi:MtaA/CmuA family methyltransferase